MKTRFLISESLQALRSNLLRSLLTIVGIVVGIFSVTAMLALGEGLSANVMDRFSSFAQGDITISGEIAPSDFSWIAEQPYVAHSLALAQINNSTVIAANTDFSPTIQVAIGNYAEVQSYTLVSGEVFDFTNRDFDEAVAVVSDGFAEAVSEETGQAVLGEDITVSGQTFTVIGVIESSSMSFTRGDGVILVPYHKAIGTLTSSKNFSSVAILLEDASYFEIAGQAILKSLNASRQLAADSEDVFSVETSQSFIESAEETTQMISVFLGIVGGIALLWEVSVP